MRFADQPTAWSLVRYVLGGLILLVGLAAASLLVLQHFKILSLPGVEDGSPCSRALASHWNQTAAWPASFVALAYLAGLFVAWFTTRREGVPGSFRGLVRLGTLVSVAYVSITTLRELYCPYCWAIHGANLAFWLLVEFSDRAVAPAVQPAVIVVVVAALICAALHVVRSEQQRLTREKAEAARATNHNPRVPAAPPPVSQGAAGEAAPRREGGPLQEPHAPTTLRQKTLAATVRIVDHTGAAAGSGVMVAVRDSFIYILTANHIIADAEHLQVQMFAPSAATPPGGVVGAVEVLARAEDADLALLRIPAQVAQWPGALPTVIRICPAGSIPEGSDFPGLTTGCDDDAGPSALVVDVEGKRLVKKPADTRNVWVWQIDRAPQKGRSGGPLIDRRGFLLGIASGTSHGKGYYEHTEEIHRFLKQHAMQWLFEE